MPDRIIIMMEIATTYFMTIVSYVCGFISIVLMTSWVSLMGLIPTILATLYWIPKIKGQVRNYHNGSYKSWFKSFLKKN